MGEEAAGKEATGSPELGPPKDSLWDCAHPEEKPKLLAVAARTLQDAGALLSCLCLQCPLSQVHQWLCCPSSGQTQSQPLQGHCPLCPAHQ